MFSRGIEVPGMSTPYYDIDAILAEEELIPCTTLFGFSNLAHLDPSYRGVDESDDELPDASVVKMPLWSVEKWSTLGFVRLSLPRHYGKRQRERLEADPGDADLRKRSERYFTSGQHVINVIEKSSTRVAQAIASTPGWRTNLRAGHAEALEKAMQGAIDLRRTLLKAYSGERLRCTLDWVLSSGDDDISKYTFRLTDREQSLFCVGASSVASQHDWRLNGNRNLLRSPVNQNGLTSCEQDSDAEKMEPVFDGEDHMNKKQRRY